MNIRFPLLQRLTVLGTALLCMGVTSKANADTFLVTSTADTSGSTCGATCTLRQAITAANATDGDHFISFASGLSGTITLQGRLPAILHTMTISGPTDSKITVSANRTYSMIYIVEGITLDVSRLTFANARSTSVRGTVFANYGTLNLSGCTLSDNQSYVTGGAIYNAGTLNVSNCTFSGNTAPYGGAIDDEGAMMLEGCTFSGNSAQQGGALRLTEPALNIANSLFANNTAESGPNIIGTIGGGDYNLIDNASGVSLPGNHNILNKVASIGALADNGGPTKTFALLEGSPAIDTGSTYLLKDQRGINRPQGIKTDIGAYEFDAVKTAPVIESVEIVPDTAKTNDTLTANATLQGQPREGLTYLYQWYKNNNRLAGETQKTLDLAKAGNGDKNDTISVVVVAKDGELESAPRPSDPLKIDNSAPVVSGVTINQAAPKTGDRLSFNIGTISDADGDTLTPTYQWKRNGQDIAGQTSAELDLAQTGNGDKDNKISVVVTVSDGTETDSFESPEVTVANTAPTVTSLEISPIKPLTDSILTASTVISDPDGDGISFNYQWKKNGQVIASETGPTLDLSKPGYGDDGDSITVVATVFDGTDYSEPFTSLPVIIGDGLPRIVSVRPQNASDKVGAKRAFTISATDGNGASDIKEMSLLINTRLNGAEGATIVYRPSSSSPTAGDLYLRRGDAFLPPIRVGVVYGLPMATPQILDNGAVRIDGNDVTIRVLDDGGITLTIPMTIRDGLVGQNTVYARVQDAAGHVDPAAPTGNAGYVGFGPYTVTPQFSGGTNSAPTLSKLTPNAATSALGSSGVAITPQTFTFSAKDENGLGDMKEIWFLAGKQRGWVNSATFYYDVRTRRLYLRSDNGSSWLGGVQVGQPDTTGILENSQVRLDLSKVKVVIAGDGKTLGLSLPLQAKTGLLGQNKVWLRVVDNQGALPPGSDAQGYVQSGTWNVTQSTAPTPVKASGGNS